MSKRIIPRPQVEVHPELHRYVACTWACWACRTTAKARVPGWPRCPRCRAPMRNMGKRWRPGRRGQWLTLAEVAIRADRQGAEPLRPGRHPAGG